MNIAEIEQRILSGPKHLNELLKLLQHLDTCMQSDSEDEQNLIKIIQSLRRVFLSLISQGRLRLSCSTKDSNESEAIETVTKWLKSNYATFRHRLYRLLGDSRLRVQVAALNALMSLLQEQSEVEGGFLNDVYLQIVEHMLDLDVRRSPDLLEVFRSFYLEKYSDLCVFFYKNVATLCEVRRLVVNAPVPGSKRKHNNKTGKINNSEYFLKNTFNLLNSLSSPNYDAEGQRFVSADVAQTQKSRYRRHFTDAWLQFLRLPLTTSMYKSVLDTMHVRLIPFMHDPKLLHTFLTEAYNAGGAMSLLALNGLFTLIHQHNLDYPDFYAKLYTLFDRNMLHLKYRSRFLKLAELFLRSTHLPAYLVAAFIKRMARLALFASPAAILSVLPMIHNLLVRHPSVRVLLHRTPDTTVQKETNETQTKAADQVASDPYDFNQQDPSLCRALDSSLWELEALKDHYYSAVATFVREFQAPLEHKKVPFDVQDFIENTTASVIADELSRKLKKTPALNDCPAVSLLGHSTSLLSATWSVSVE